MVLTIFNDGCLFDIHDNLPEGTRFILVWLCNQARIRSCNQPSTKQWGSANVFTRERNKCTCIYTVCKRVILTITTTGVYGVNTCTLCFWGKAIDEIHFHQKV